MQEAAAVVVAVIVAVEEDKVLVWVVAEVLVKEEAVEWVVEAVVGASDWGPADTAYVFNVEKKLHTREVFLAINRDAHPVEDA